METKITYSVNKPNVENGILGLTLWFNTHSDHMEFMSFNYTTDLPAGIYLTESSRDSLRKMISSDYFGDQYMNLENSKIHIKIADQNIIGQALLRYWKFKYLECDPGIDFGRLKRQDPEKVRNGRLCRQIAEPGLNEPTDQ